MILTKKKKFKILKIFFLSVFFVILLFFYLVFVRHSPEYPNNPVYDIKIAYFDSDDVYVEHSKKREVSVIESSVGNFNKFSKIYIKRLEDLADGGNEVPQFNIWISEELKNITLFINGSALISSDWIEIPQKDIYVSVNGKRFRGNRFEYKVLRGEDSEYEITTWLSLIKWKKRYKMNRTYYIYWLGEEEFQKLKQEKLKEQKKKEWEEQGIQYEDNSDQEETPENTEREISTSTDEVIEE